MSVAEAAFNYAGRFRERPVKVPVLALTEAVSAHVDGRPEQLVAVVEAGHALAVGRGHQLRGQRAPVLVDLARDLTPVGAVDAVRPPVGCGVHAASSRVSRACLAAGPPA